MQSLILTIHNKDFLVEESLNRLKKYTKPPYEIIVILDGCSDKSEEIVLKFKKENYSIKMKIEYAPDVFETKSNNIGLKLSESEYSIIIQDDMLINEMDWNIRLMKPFELFEDIFAVSANCSHNWVFNPNSKHLGMKQNLDDCWCDIINHVDHAGKSWDLPRNMFAVRQTCNRGPLALNNNDLVKLNYLDEVFAPLDMDDHDLCFRAKKKLNKNVGCYWIDFISDFSWGGTHGPNGHKPWFYKSNHKNMKIVWERHSDIIQLTRKIDNRIIN